MDERARNSSTADLAKADDRPRRSRPADADALELREEARQKGEATAEESRPPIEERAMLLPADEPERLRTRWSEIQGTFVDSPRQAVERADALVADVMKRMAEIFANERASLEQQWDRGDKVTTEDLRIALQRYRAFFDRLLAV